MKFGQLIEYNMVIFFLKNHTQNVVENNKSQNLAYLWINSLKCYTVCFYVFLFVSSRGLPKYFKIY